MTPPAGSKSGARRTSKRGDADRTFLWLTVLLTLVATVARNHWVFSQHTYEHGDAALISVLVQNGHHGLLLTGPVSRIGFPHPGPAYLYVLAAGQSLFHDWLPLTASGYGGQFIGASVLQAMMLGLVVRTLYRLTRSVSAGLISLGIVFWFAASRELLGETWLPNLYMTTFMLLLISGIAVSIGVTRELPLLVFAGALLIHGHVAFLFFVGVTWLVTALSWLARHRADARLALRAARSSLWWTLAIAVLFAAPMVAEVVLHSPGPWPAYLHYKGAGGGNGDAESLRFLGHFWSASYPVPVAILAGAGAAAGLLLDRDKPRLRLFIHGYSMLLLQTALILFYIVRGVDAVTPINYYTGFFYENVPMFLLLFAVVHLGLLAWDRFSGFRPLGWVAAAGVLALIVAGSLAPSLTMTGQSYPSVKPMLAALTSDPDRAGRPIVIRFQHDDWSFVAASLVQARRQGIPICITDPFWKGLFTQALMCPATAGHWAVASVPRRTYHGGQHVIWSDSAHVVFEGTVPDVGPEGT